jgi:hypothetical protein
MADWCVAVSLSASLRAKNKQKNAFFVGFFLMGTPLVLMGYFWSLAVSRPTFKMRR